MPLPLSIQHAGLGDLAGGLRSAQAEIEGRLEALADELAALDAGWSGEAKAAYFLAQREWNASLERMRLVLEDATTIVDVAGTRHREAEKRAAGLW